MIDDNLMEEIAAYGAKLFKAGQSADDAIALIQEKYHNVNNYIISGIFRGIRAANDLIKVGS